VREPIHLLKPRETPKDFEFSQISTCRTPAAMLVQGLDESLDRLRRAGWSGGD